MNFYRRYMADYARKTSRLSLMQHGAYNLLLDELYSNEQPLPAAYDELYRICRAMHKAEQEAVRMVADQFFPVGDDGLRHNERATEEMAAAAPAIEAARLNGKKGGRPPKKPNEKPTGFTDGTQNEPGVKASHSSDISPSLRSGEMRASRLPADWQLPAEWSDWARGERPDLDIRRTAEGFADYWRSQPGKDGRKLDWLATWRNWVRNERRSTGSPHAETPWQRSQRERVAEMTGGLVSARAPGQQPANIVEMQHAPSKLLG